MELLVIERGRELLRGVVQLGLDARADAEAVLAGVAGADGMRRGRVERGHARPVVTTLGEVSVRRIGYRSGIRGAGSLFPRDAVLDLPPGGYSWQLQRLAEMSCRAVSYEQAREFVLAATGISVGRRQLEQIVLAAAADAGRFCQDPGRPRDEVLLPGAGGACRRWRCRRTAREWRCCPGRAAAPARPRASGPGTSASGAGPGRRQATSGWPRPAASSTSRSRTRTARPAPRSRSWALILTSVPARPGRGR
ncbi:MAG TPA: hypothetical protein VFV73_19705 [Streptosporangiaceae bacterium]|nr:hypothetical protein [Streptosporangiaceae bacterium]